MIHITLTLFVFLLHCGFQPQWNLFEKVLYITKEQTLLSCSRELVGFKCYNMAVCLYLLIAHFNYSCISLASSKLLRTPDLINMRSQGTTSGVEVSVVRRVFEAPVYVIAGKAAAWACLVL